MKRTIYGNLHKTDDCPCHSSQGQPFGVAFRVAFTASFLSEIIETLTDEDLRSALDYVRFLSASRKKAAKATMKQIQGIFADDKGWKDEQEMLADMANFRRTRTA